MAESELDSVKLPLLHLLFCNEYVHGPRPQPLQFDICPGLSSLNSLQHNNNKLKLVTTSRRLKKPHALIITSEHHQNADFPRTYSRKEKPFPVPVLELRRAARERFKNSKGKPIPPKNGLVVRSLIPLAYDVLNARTTLIKNLKKLMKVVLVQACGWCHEIHVGSVGLPFRSCKGKYATLQKGQHYWPNATIEDILVPIEAYDLFDHLRKLILNEQRFSVPRIPVVVELCIQAGESDLPDPAPLVPELPVSTETPDSDIKPPSDEDETRFLAWETLRNWKKMRKGTKRLMRMYPVRVCGYCPEVHVGPSGHRRRTAGPASTSSETVSMVGSRRCLMT